MKLCSIMNRPAPAPNAIVETGHCATYNQFTGHGPEAIQPKNETHAETGRRNSATVEQFAGRRKTNSIVSQQYLQEQHL